MEVYSGLIELNWTSLMVLCNVLILYFILKRFFFSKIHDFMQARSKSISDAIEDAEAKNKKADAKMANYNARIANAEAEGREIVKEAKTKADAQAKLIIDDANKEAGEIIARAELAIEKEKAKAMSDMKAEITAIALMAAEKIVEKEISKVGQDEIVSEVIEQARSTGWQQN